MVNKCKVNSNTYFVMYVVIKIAKMTKKVANKMIATRKDENKSK